MPASAGGGGTIPVAPAAAGVAEREPGPRLPGLRAPGSGMLGRGPVGRGTAGTAPGVGMVPGTGVAAGIAGIPEGVAGAPAGVAPGAGASERMASDAGLAGISGTAVPGAVSASFTGGTPAGFVPGAVFCASNLAFSDGESFCFVVCALRASGTDNSSGRKRADLRSMAIMEKDEGL